MITTGELALVAAVLAPLLGLGGVLAGTWATRSASRRQQKIDAAQRHYERVSESYENMLAGMEAAVLSLGERLKTHATGQLGTPERDQAEAHQATMLRVRGLMLASPEVREAHGGWAKQFSQGLLVARAPAESRESKRVEWLGLAAGEALKVMQAMAADLERLRESTY